VFVLVGAFHYPHLGLFVGIAATFMVLMSYYVLPLRQSLLVIAVFFLFQMVLALPLKHIGLTLE
jgi:hypothetical protein